MGDALVVAGADGAIRTANPAAAALFITTQEEMLGRRLIDFFLRTTVPGRGTAFAMWKKQSAPPRVARSP